jgi:predicted nucleotidyltransferase
VHDRQVGRSRLYSAATDHRAAAALSQLLALTFGPQVVVEEAFADIEGVHSVHIYGSWAARYSGEPGRPPADVDVMVVGNPSRADAYAVADAAQERLGLQVNPTVRTVDQWNDPTDALVAQIQASPLVTVYEEGVDG